MCDFGPLLPEFNPAAPTRSCACPTGDPSPWTRARVSENFPAGDLCIKCPNIVLKLEDSSDKDELRTLT
jgi:hypothetical protein